MPAVPIGAGDVERRPRQMAGRQGRVEGILVDERFAGGVDEVRARLHGSEQLAVEQILGRGRRARVKRHEVGVSDESLEIGYALDPTARVRLGEWVVRPHLHTECERSGRPLAGQRDRNQRDRVCGR